MTELQMGLIGLGAAAVAGVLGYNKWQEIRQRKAAEALLKPQHADVLLKTAVADPVDAPAVRNEPVMAPEVPVEAARREPVLNVPEVPDPMPTDVRPARAAIPLPSLPDGDETLPVLNDPVPLTTSVGEMPEVPAAMLDARLDYIVALDLAEPVSALQILHSQRDTLRQVGKPVHWLGFNELTREWERLAIDRDIPLRHLRIGLQLVNRMGPLGAGDLAIFSAAMQDLADELLAVAVQPPTAGVLEQAAGLDGFCAGVDLEIGLNLISRGSAFSGTKIRALAEAAGMVLGSDGLFTRYDDDGRALFCLQNYETAPFAADSLRTLGTHGLTFLLDVPRVDNGDRVFQQLTELAKRFAETLQGVLVDDNRQPLSDGQLDHIRREFIGKPQLTMAAYGLPAGSPQARRLFS